MLPRLRRPRGRETLGTRRNPVMQWKDLMSREVEVIHPNATIAKAGQRMEALDVGPLPVCDGERLVGMLTDRDITVRATADGQDPNTTPVCEMMILEVLNCFEDQEADGAARYLAPASSPDNGRQKIRQPLLSPVDQYHSDLSPMDRVWGLSGVSM
jgi:CBS domain-containing protein